MLKVMQALRIFRRESGNKPAIRYTRDGVTTLIEYQRYLDSYVWEIFDADGYFIDSGYEADLEVAGDVAREAGARFLAGDAQ